MLKFLLILSSLIIIQIRFGFSQILQFVTESESHIYWQQNRKLTLSDFQGEPKATDVKDCSEYGYCSVPCLGIFCVVDISKHYKRNKLEMVYFAPAFQKSCSYIINDTKDISSAQLLFDIAELSSRIGRKLLREYHDYIAITSDSMNLHKLEENPDTILITGIGTSLAWHARDSAWNLYQEMSNNFIRNVYLSHGKESFDEWRLMVDNLLDKYNKYATKPEECYRLVKKEPIIKNYKEAYK
jgi:hypothetical protein